MAAATLLRATRTPTIVSEWTVPTFADLNLNSATIGQGDHVTVLSTGFRYTCYGPDTFTRTVVDPVAPDTSAGQFHGWFSNFGDGTGKAVADTTTSATLAGSGLRIHGQGIDETDSGLTVAYGVGGPVASLITTDEASHLAAIGVGGDTEPWDPATYGPFSVEAVVAMSSVLTLRTFFIGFIGVTTAALDPVVTGSTTTLTLVQDDVCGLYMDVGLTAATELFAPHNKADEAATIATTATGVDTGVVFPAAGTYCKLRVTVLANGTMICYKDDVEITRIAAAASTTVKLTPILYVSSTSTATKTMLVKSFSARSYA